MSTIEVEKKKLLRRYLSADLTELLYARNVSREYSNETLVSKDAKVDLLLNMKYNKTPTPSPWREASQLEPEGGEEEDLSEAGVGATTKSMSVGQPSTSHQQAATPLPTRQETDDAPRDHFRQFAAAVQQGQIKSFSGGAAEGQQVHETPLSAQGVEATPALEEKPLPIANMSPIRSIADIFKDVSLNSATGKGKVDDVVAAPDDAVLNVNKRKLELENSRDGRTSNITAVKAALTQRSLPFIDPALLSICKKPDGSYQGIGEGGFGKIYLGEINMGPRDGIQQVALKVSIKEDIDQLNAEMRMHPREGHRNLCTVFGVTMIDVGDSSNFKHALALEYCSQGDLHSMLHKQRLGEIKKSITIESGRGMPILLDIASGVQYLHSCHLFHRDIKTQNVLIRTNSSGGLSALLCDLGGAKKINANNNMTAAEIGTKTHAPPEVWGQDRTTTAVDTFYYGMTLFEVVNHKHDIADVYNTHGAIGLEQLKAHKFIVPNGYGLRTDVDMILQGLYMSCIEYEPDKRPSFKKIVAVLKALNCDG